ncbi:MAG: right-handed parallel beta-helix repeat-containing protein [Saprospiraceae bacterium]|nr:right-handed parallel beta-helix repeat-containing protein [Saprospiraceae bacterium]
MSRTLPICCWLVAIAATLSAQPALEKQLQTQLILAADGDTIALPAGNIILSNTLSLDAKKDITIRGAGQDKTTLSFKNQQQGAEGIKVTNAQNIVLEHFTIEDSKGDLIKTQAVNGLVFRDITARWNGKPKKTNGAYALYPVQCQNVRIERCTAIGASDAGIYVGQSDSVWVTRCYAKNNVAGIEIENTTNAWVYENIAAYNTGGVLVFDLPDLPKKRGGHVKVWKNKIIQNNHKNFAPKGNIVGQVPPGTGVMILATNDVEVHDNFIMDNKTASTAIVSYFITELPIKDKEYNPYPSNIHIHDNVYSEGKRTPTRKNKMGTLFWLKFGRRVPHIIYDGIQNPGWLAADGSLQPGYRICIRNNENGTFANIRAHKIGLFKSDISRDSKPYDCELNSLSDKH